MIYTAPKSQKRIRAQSEQLLVGDFTAQVIRQLSHVFSHNVKK